MANLKGSTFAKQIVNAKSRLNAIGQRRYGSESHKTHSVATAIKRDMYLRDFARYCESRGLNDGKLNEYMNEQHISEFINERVADLSAKSALDYVTGFNSMLQGLKESNVTINDNAINYLKEVTKDFRAEFNDVKENYDTGRSISDTSQFLHNLNEIREESAIVAQLQLETGLRVSEALEVAKNVDQYLKDTNTISGVIGKGGQLYNDKHISNTLAQKLQNTQINISYSTYQRDIKALDHTTHDLRITYAKSYYEEKIEQGYTHREALQATSVELNHHREAITSYYLARA